MIDAIETCARLSAAIYTGAIPDDIGVTQWHHIRNDETDTLALVCVTDDALIITVQGSESKRDWLNNIKIVKTEYHGIRAHKGFAWCAESILPDVLAAIARDPVKPVILTGHSLGGAIATLLAVALRPHAVKLITFGQPRVSTLRELKLALYGEYIRVVNGSDVVPRSPWLGYSHAGTCVYLDNEGRKRIDPGEIAMFADRTMTLKQHQRGTDHRAGDYVTEYQRCTEY
jgi:hypothetical protein